MLPSLPNWYLRHLMIGCGHLESKLERSRLKKRAHPVLTILISVEIIQTVFGLAALLTEHETANTHVHACDWGIYT